jgi:hypothetical protein
MRHKYDDPTLSSVGFLFAVMHDPSLPIEDRLEAAKNLIDIGYGDLSAERPPAILYQIADFRPPGG